MDKLVNEENTRQRRPEEVIRVQEEVESTSKEKASTALKKVNRGKVVAPKNLLAEVWQCLGEARVRYLTRAFSKLLLGARCQRKAVPPFKNNGELQCCGSYKGIKLMSHTMNLWERVVENILTALVEINK